MNRRSILGHCPHFALGVFLTFLPGALQASNDPLLDLARGLEKFRGLGLATIQSYRVPLSTPQEKGQPDAPSLVEIWRAPSTIALRAQKPSTPGALVRGQALYLEPLYVARTGVVDLDWSNLAESVRARVQATSKRVDGQQEIRITFASNDSPDLPESLRDIERIEARLDARQRLIRLRVGLREGGGEIAATCRYDERQSKLQPVEAKWTLPDGQLVTMSAGYRREGKFSVPSWRRVEFPSRFDPKESEIIEVHYGTYEINPSLTEGDWSGAGAFRFTSAGLVTASAPQGSSRP